MGERGRERGKGWLKGTKSEVGEGGREVRWFLKVREGGREVIGWLNLSPKVRWVSEGGRVVSG